MLLLVCHGRPLPEPGLLPSAWELDPAGFDAIWALRESGRLPRAARWFTSPEPKAVATAHLLTDGDVGVVDGLRDQARETATGSRTSPGRYAGPSSSPTGRRTTAGSR